MMPKFNRERAKTELGWTDAQIDAYLSSAQARLDSTATATQVAGGADPLGMIGGMGAGAMDAIGGPRTLIGGGLLGGAGMLARHVMKNRGQDPPNAAPAASAVKPPNPAEARISEARAMKMEADARAATARADLAERKLAPQEAAPKRTTTPKAAKPRRTTKPPDPIPIRTASGASRPSKAPSNGGQAPSTVPIDVQGKPKAVRGAKQRGVTKREIASRQRGMAASRLPAALPKTDDMMEQLSRSLHVEQGMRARGVPSSTSIRGPVRAGLRGIPGKIPGALGLLLSLMDAGAIPEQMDEAQRFGQEQFNPELAEYLRRLGSPESL